MSRRETPALDPRHTAYVGWDRPLLSFFGQVYDETADEDASPIFWIGADYPGQLRELNELAATMAPYADIPPAMLATLQHDRETER